jgi:hypothetical protein
VSLARPRVRALALLAFLARGGIIALALPIVVLPSPIGIGIWVGPTSVTAAGPTPRLVVTVVAMVTAVSAVSVIAFVIAAAAEVALHRATAAPDPDVPQAGIASTPSAGRGAAGTIRVALVRLALVLPVIAVVALAVPPLVEAGYRELTLPSDVGVPLVVRILAAAPLAVAAVVATWLAAEVVGGLASRRVVLLGSSVGAGIGEALADVVRRPAALALSFGASAAVSILLLMPALLAALAAADRAGTVLARSQDPLAAVGAALLLTAVFAGTVVLAAGAAAWRAALWTAEVLRAAGVRPPGS